MCRTVLGLNDGGKILGRAGPRPRVSTPRKICGMGPVSSTVVLVLVSTVVLKVKFLSRSIQYLENKFQSIIFFLHTFKPDSICPMVDIEIPELALTQPQGWQLLCRLKANKNNSVETWTVMSTFQQCVNFTMMNHENHDWWTNKICLLWMLRSLTDLIMTYCVWVVSVYK